MESVAPLLFYLASPLVILSLADSFIKLRAAWLIIKESDYD